MSIYLKFAISISLVIGTAFHAGCAHSTQSQTVEAIEAGQDGELLIYGESEDRQRLLYWKGASSDAPLVVYVHGGAWRLGDHTRVFEKADWARRHGYAFASIGYRMVPEVHPGEQAGDVGAGLRFLRSLAAELGFDDDRILLMGHSAGAHLSALLGTDPRHAGSAFNAIQGVLLLDGAAYDVPRQIGDTKPFLRRSVYFPAFGRDRARQVALSPITHAGQRDVSRWFILHSDQREDAKTQAAALAGALGDAAVARVFASPLTHGQINQEFGNADYPGMATIDDFVESSLSE